MLAKVSKRPVAVTTNYYRFKATAQFHKYQISIEPDIDEQDAPLLKRVLRLCLPALRTHFQKFFLSNQLVFYSAYLVDDFSFQVQLDHQEELPLDLTIRVQKVGVLDMNRPEHINVIGRFFKTMQASLRLKNFGRAFFDPSQKREVSQFNLETWPGFETQVKLVNDRVLLCVESCSKVVRLDSALAALKALRSQGKTNEQLDQAFHLVTVVTSYNKRNYRVSGLDFIQNPSSTFSLKGQHTSYLEYYKNMYNLAITDLQQPLLVFVDSRKEKRTGEVQEPIYLIPELCYMTGLTDKMRNDFQLMRELAKDTKQEAPLKQKTIQGLIERLHSEDTPKDMMKSNKIEVDASPVKTQGYSLSAGKMTFLRSQVKVEDNRDLERQVQTAFLSPAGQPLLTKWVIFYCQRDQPLFEKFTDMFQQVIQQYQQKVADPKVVPLASVQNREWLQALSILDPTVNIAVALLPGPKKAAPLYKDVKRHCHAVGVPCQVILTKTLMSSGLRSICNKVLTQMCAKVGHVPWGMDQLPFTQVPTMLIGIDMYQRSSGTRKYVMALTATLDKNLASYFNDVTMTNDLEEAHASVLAMSRKALLRFKEYNNDYSPHHIIVYREGVSEGQLTHILDKEIQGNKANPQGIRRAMLELKIQAKLVVITVVKKVAAKVFAGGGDNLRVTNPQPGTLVHSEVVEKNSFLLVSCKQNQGMTSPTKYSVIWSDLGFSEEVMDQFYLLTYKLTHMYYNWSGAIKVPAPCKNADLLANFHGERYDEVVAHQALVQKNSQYYL